MFKPKELEVTLSTIHRHARGIYKLQSILALISPVI